MYYTHDHPYYRATYQNIVTYQQTVVDASSFQ